MNDSSTPLARARFFQLAALGFAHPRAEWHAELQSGELGRLLQASALAGFSEALPLIQTDLQFPEQEAAYIDLFQVGRRGRPRVHLNAGEYGELCGEHSRPELLLRYSSWYRHFGLAAALEGEHTELPDHLVCQLEFLCWLCQLEAGSKDSACIDGYRQAQADFIEQQLLPLLTLLTEAIEQQAPETLYRALAQGILRCASGLRNQHTPSAQDEHAARITAVNLWD